MRLPWRLLQLVLFQTSQKSRSWDAHGARGVAETQLEMTDAEVDLRNKDLREQQDSRRWTVYDCRGGYSIRQATNEMVFIEPT